MTGKDIVREFEDSRPDIEDQIREALEQDIKGDLDTLYDESTQAFEPGSILEGTVLSVANDIVIVDVGYKSEGTVRLNEFRSPDEAEPGSKVEVLLEAVEDDSGVVVLSKRRADRIRGWERIVNENEEGNVVRGRVMRKIKGGLLVDIGVPVFLPASQVSIRRTGDIAEYIGKELECKIIKIDRERRNIVVSRRRLLEEQREDQKRSLLAEIQVAEIRRGVVKNITDFGAFVDLGGIDGLLHITDMSWGRISHPSEMVALEDVVEVMVLSVDKEKEKISLGLKQKTPSPWVGIEEKYPVGSHVKGQVVNVTSYGGFVKLEEGVEGLVHISEMSWTRRINHPSELVAIGDIVEVVVLGINMEKEEISLGMKQTEINPWTLVKDKYPAGTIIKGRVRNLTNYGAFVEIEEGIDGLLHVSDMSWTKKISHPSEVLKKGEKVEAMVIAVDPDRKRIALGLRQLQEDPWTESIPAKYKVGDIVKGTATKLTNFGVFVELEDGLEGLLHVTEISDERVESAEDVIGAGQELELKVIRMDSKERKIGLSLKQMSGDTSPEASSPAEDEVPAEEPAVGSTEVEAATAAPVDLESSVDESADTAEPAEPGADQEADASDDTAEVKAEPAETEEEESEKAEVQPEDSSDAPGTDNESSPSGDELTEDQKPEA